MSKKISAIVYYDAKATTNEKLKDTIGVDTQGCPVPPSQEPYLGSLLPISWKSGLFMRVLMAQFEMFFCFLPPL